MLRDPSYEGEQDALYPLLAMDFEMTLRWCQTHPDRVHWDDNCELELHGPMGTIYNIFIDCGDFDYFDWVEMPGGTKIDFGASCLRELEYNVGTDQLILIQNLYTY